MNTTEYKERLKAKCQETGHSIKVKEDYVNAHTNIIHKCYKCNHRWAARPCNILNIGSGCPNCTIKFKPKLLIDHVKAIPEEFKNKWIILDPLDSVTPRKVKVRCYKCEYETEHRITLIKKGINCLRCTKNYKKTTEDFINESKAKFGDILDYSKTKYVSAHRRVSLICREHGKFRVVATQHLNAVEHPCPLCAKEVTSFKTTLTEKEVTRRLKNIHGKKYKYDKVIFVNTHTRIMLTCKDHGDFSVLPYNVFSKIESGCPRCSKAVTKPHAKICDLLKEHGIKYETNRRILDGKEIDVWIPDHKLGIEVNGIYWHSAEVKPKNYHADKSRVAASKEITLLHFWDSEISNNFALVSSLILHKLGKSKRRFARNFSVVSSPDKERVKRFLNKSHLQGYCSYSKAVTLQKGEKIYAVMTFRRPRFDKDFDWEIIRFCVRKGYAIAGGASKLLTNFRRINTGTILSYANNLYSDGNVYESLGMTYLKTTSPSYVWIKGDLQLSRYQCQKKKLFRILPNFDKDSTEDENMRAHNFKKVYDAGHHKYALMDKKILDSRATI